MAEQIEINGLSTWVEKRGSGKETVLLLHGGLSNSDLLLDALSKPLETSYRVVAFDRRGHGYTADTAEPFHYDEMATETIGVLEKVVGGRAHLVGWSDGGIVGLLVALRRPDLVDRLVVIGTNYHFDGALPLDFDPNSEFAAMIFQAYAERSPDGGEHFEEIAGKFMNLVTTEPTLTVEDLKNIVAPTLVMAGDDDMIKLSHTAELYEALPNGQLSVVPGTSHALPIERSAETARVIVDFLQADTKPSTFMPIRRAAKPPTP
jgi:pimeloyl-ACP methyl ester carboxylesterase